jgi:uncharacterized SAM-dependent methyltransferase
LPELIFFGLPLCTNFSVTLISTSFHDVRLVNFFLLMLNDMNPPLFVEAALIPQRRASPAMLMATLAADIAQPLPLLLVAGPGLLFYPELSVGNSTLEEAPALLTRLHAQCAGQGGVLLGFNLVKDTAVLHAAYNRVLSVAATFNLNLLRHLNQLIGSDFDPEQWEQKAGFTRVRQWIDARLFRLVDDRRLSRITS